MTPRQQLIQEIEQVPDAIVEELFDFLLLAKMKHHRQQEQSFASFVQNLVEDIPPNVLATLPTDGAAEHDHYLYGTPKRELL